MNSPASFTLGIIGYGKMGGALHRGWLAAGYHARYIIISPDQAVREDGTSRFYNDINDPDTQQALADCDLVLLAVKPQILADVCASLKAYIAPGAVILSIAAGQSLAVLQSYFTPQQAIVRSMPNTPAAIGKGVSGYVPNALCTAAHLDRVQDLLSIAGHVHALPSEALMNALNAVSGSGPAYLFYFTEALTQAAEKAGLPADLAAALARQTVIGSASLMDADSDVPPATLRQNVTSPGGTTQAALEFLMDGRLQDVMNDAIDAAVRRAEDL